MYLNGNNDNYDSYLVFFNYIIYLFYGIIFFAKMIRGMNIKVMRAEGKDCNDDD